MSERAQAVDDVIAAIDLAMETYTSNGALLALTLGNKNFGGDSALSLIKRGETQRVMDWLEGLTGMIAT